MSKKPAPKKGGKVDTDNLSPEEILVEYIKLNNVEEIEKLFEQCDDLNPNFPILEEVKKETDSRPTSVTNGRNSKMKNKKSAEKEEEIEDDEIEEEEETEKFLSDTPFTLAIRLGFLEAAKCLVQHQADFNGKAKGDENCLHIIVDNFKDKQEDEDLLKFVLKLESPAKVIVDRDAKNAKGETPLFMAIQQYKARVAELLMEGGASHEFNAKNPNSNLTMLHESAANGDVKLLTTLLAIGQSPFQKDHITGRTMLHYAALHQKKEIFDFLIKRKFDASFVNAEDAQGNTALSITCDFQNWDLFKLLTTKLGADMHQLSSVDGLSLLHRAIYQDNKETIEKLLSMKFKITTLDRFGNTALHWAVSSSIPDIVKNLIERKSDVNAQNNSGNTPLHNAAFIGNLNAVHILLDKKASVKTQNKHLRTSLHEAASRGNPEVIELLVKKGGNTLLEMEDENGLTALQIAINEGQIHFAIELLRQGANPEREYKSYVQNGENELALLNGTRTGDIKNINLDGDTEDYGTIIHQAILKSYEDLVEQLVQCGASVSKLDKKGMTPLHNAVRMNNLPIVNSLASKGATIDISVEDITGYSPLIMACLQSNFELCDYLVSKRNASTSFVDAEQKTPLHHAACVGRLDIVKLLVENGADVNCVDSFRRSPLHEACRKNNIEVVRYLLENNSDLGLQDDQGYTSLHLAVFSGSADSAIALIEKGANLNIKDKLDRTALIVASQAGQTVCGRILVQAWNEKKNGAVSFQSLYNLLTLNP